MAAQRQTLLAEERTRIARELHDTTAHHLSSIAIQTTAARAILHSNPTAVEKQLEGISTSISQALADVRATVNTLRTPTEAEATHTPQPTIARIPDLITECRNLGMSIRVTGPGLRTNLTAPEQQCAYRTIQEALTNARKHASGAPVTINLDEAGLMVTTHGIFTPGEPRRIVPGRGSVGMQERANHCGATLINEPDSDGWKWPSHGNLIRVIIADDEALIRAGLATILQASGDIEVIGEASTGEEALAAAQRLQPDVVCMDIRMPGGDGLEATRRIQQLEPAPAVIVITTFDMDEYVFGALEAGACGILLKDSSMTDLVEGVRRAALGEGLVDASLTRRVIAEFTRRKSIFTSSSEVLTPRELDCVAQLCQGMSNNEIATTLFLEPSTVKTHLSSAMAKTGTHNRVQLVIWAFRNGVVE